MTFICRTLKSALECRQAPYHESHRSTCPYCRVCDRHVGFNSPSVLRHHRHPLPRVPHDAMTGLGEEGEGNSPGWIVVCLSVAA